MTSQYHYGIYSQNRAAERHILHYSMQWTDSIRFLRHAAVQTELITRSRMLYGGTASSWDLVPRCRA